MVVALELFGIINTYGFSRYVVYQTGVKEKYEDTKGVIRCRYSMKYRQHNGNKKNKRTNNDLQNITQKAKDKIPVHSKHLTTFVRQIPLLDYTVELCSLEMSKQGVFR